MTATERSAAIERLEEVLRTHERIGPDGAPGFAVAVAAGDDLLVRRGLGLASIEHKVPIGPRTAFRIASVSKQFTCAAILLLARQGKLDIDADIREVLPDCLPGLSSVPRGALSIRLLMHMASGLRDFLTMLRAGGAELDTRVSPQQVREMVARHARLNFTPNSRFLYCNTNYLLLGLAVESVGGLSLGEFLRRNLFEPLGMADTRHTPDPDAVEPDLACAYLVQGSDPRGGKWLRAQQRVPLGGEGGLVSTLDDLLAWAQALRKPPRELHWLPGELRRTLDFGHNHPNVYARGQEVLSYRGLTTIGHGGLWPGYRTEFLLVPELDITAIVIANDSGINPHTLARRLLDALLAPRLGAVLKSAPPQPGLYFQADAGLAIEIGGTNPMHGNAPTLTLFSAVVPLRAQAEDWFEAEAGAIVLKVRAIKDASGAPALELIDDAGARFTLKKIDRAAALPDGIAGAWRCDELGTTWTIETPERACAGESAPGASPGAFQEAFQEAAISVSGPIVAASAGWRAKSLAGEWVEIVAASKFMPASFTARLERSGGARRLLVHTARARGLVFTFR